jgi:uncharacterized protein involved in exopolysaccharide biosynthesis
VTDSERNTAEDDLSLLAILGMLLRRRKLVLLVPLVLVAATLLVSLVIRRSYTSQSSFVPQQQGPNLSKLMGLASQLGVNVGSQDAGQSPDFYAALIVSDALLMTVAGQQYSVPAKGDTARGDLARMYGISEGDSARRLDKAVERLRRHLSVSAETRTSIVEYKVTERSAALAHQVAAAILAGINDFNLRSRRTRAGEERRFLEARVKEAADELRAAEDASMRFQQANRSVQTPGLTIERDRLQRAAGLKQTVYSSLLQSYEQARMEEVRSTPVVTVVEAPSYPARPDSRLLGVKALAALLVGLALGVALAFLTEFLAWSARREPVEAGELRQLASDTAHDLRRVLRVQRGKNG